MSRSGYSDDCAGWDLIRYRGQVASATKGKRGQQFFRDLVAALDGMPDKALVAGDLETPRGEVCALGALGRVRGLDLQTVDPEDTKGVGTMFNIAHQLAAEVVYMNDEILWGEDPKHRWRRMRDWAASQIVDPGVAA